MKPFSEACERNKQVILSVIESLLADKTSLLEIGSGNGQHAVFFAEKLPHIQWQTSDCQENHAAINQWLNESPANNVIDPIALDVLKNHWPAKLVDAVFSANTAHIMPWNAVEAFFAGVGKILESGGIFILYGPFNYAGKFTSESNERFEQWLKNVDIERGIRDFEAVNQLADKSDMILIEDYPMPANNRLLVWKKE